MEHIRECCIKNRRETWGNPPKGIIFQLHPGIAIVGEGEQEDKPKPRQEVRKGRNNSEHRLGWLECENGEHCSDRAM